MFSNPVKSKVKSWKEPRCADACPTGSLKFGEESELKELGYSGAFLVGNKDEIVSCIEKSLIDKRGAVAK